MDLLKRKYDAISYKENCLKESSTQDTNPNEEISKESDADTNPSSTQDTNPNEENHRDEENGNGNEVDSEDNGCANPQFINPQVFKRNGMMLSKAKNNSKGAGFCGIER